MLHIDNSLKYDKFGTAVTSTTVILYLSFEKKNRNAKIAHLKKLPSWNELFVFISNMNDKTQRKHVNLAAASI